MAVEFYSSPIPKLCDQARAQTYSPGIVVRFNNNNNKKKKKKKQDAIPNALCTMTVRPL